MLASFFEWEKCEVITRQSSMHGEEVLCNSYLPRTLVLPGMLRCAIALEGAVQCRLSNGHMINGMMQIKVPPASLTGRKEVVIWL